MKKIFNIVVLMVCAISFSFAQSNVIIYASNNGSGNGKSVETPTSLQGAIDTIKNAVAASETTYEVRLIAGEYTGNLIGIGQQANKNVIIKPNDGTCTMKVVFVIDGNGRSTGSESVTFNSLTFDGGRITGGAVADDLGTDDVHSYPHNINIENCNFSNSGSNFMIENKSGVAAYNWKISGCSFTNCDFPIQAGGGGENLQVLNCNFNNCIRGINLNHSINPLISNCTFTGVTKYAIRLGQGSGTPDHTPEHAMHVNGCTISGSPLETEDGLIVLRGDCRDMIIGNTTTVSATGSNPVAFCFKQEQAKVYVDDADTLILTGNVDHAIEGKSFTSHLVIQGSSNYKLPGTYCSVGTMWIGPDNWLYHGAQQPALSLNENGISEISTAAQLARLSCEVLTNTLPSFSGKRTFKVVRDIDLNDHIWFPIGTKDQSFSDNFDGGNHTISNLHINQPDDSYLALIGRCQDNATIKNVVLNNVDITGFECVAGICGQTYVGTLFNNHVRGTVKITGSHFVGAISGHVYGNTYFCSVDGGNSSLIKGITHSIPTTDSTHTEYGYPVGGLTGYQAEGGYSIMNSSAKIKVIANGRVGGLIGYLNANSKIVDCYHRGNVTYGDGSDNILSEKSGMGGIVGEALSGIQLVNCYHTGDINNPTQASAANAGFLVGKSSSPTVTNSYYNSESTLTNGSSSFGVGKTASEMKNAAMATTLGGAYRGVEGDFPVLLQVPQGEGTETDPYIIASDNDLAFVAVMSHTTDNYLKSVFHNAYYTQTEDLTLKANDSITIQANMTYTVGSGKTLTVSGKIIDNANGKLIGADATSQLTIAEGAVYGTKTVGTYVWVAPQWVDPNSSWLYIGAQQPALTYNGGVCEINSAKQLARMSYEVNYDLLPTGSSPITFKLTADINLGGHEWCPIGYKNDDGFVDNFDGQNHTISNMTITDASPCLATWGNALFGTITADTIENFKLADVNVYPAKDNVKTCAAAGVAGVAMGATLRNIEIESGNIRTDYGSCVSGAVAYLSVYKESDNKIHNSYMYNVVNRATLIDGSGLYKGYAIIGGIAGLIANDYGYYSADNGQIIFEKCANFGELKSVNPYQLLSDGKITDGKTYGYTIAGQIAGQCSHTAKTYIVFDSCVTGGTIYGNKTLTCSGGSLSEGSGRCVFQGKKWTGINESVDNGYTSEDYYFGNEKVYFTAKNANEISEALKEENFIENDGIFDNSSKKPNTTAEHQAIIATKSLIATAAGGAQTFVFRAAAMVGDKVYLNADSAAKNNLPGTIVLIASDTCAEQTQWDANDTIQTIRNVKIVVPANATLTVNGTLELGNHAQCVGTDETSRIIVTRKCTGATETENINPGIYYWDASENKWVLVQEE